jgi:Mn2+/Fe2+ NRAMP family transporter
VGAKFGYEFLWSMLLSYPLMSAFQEICARVGRVTGCGIAANLRKYYPKPLLYTVIGLMGAANIFNLGADIGAMGSATALLFPINTNILIIIFGVFVTGAVVFVPYSAYSKYLKWLTLSLFAYVAVAFRVPVPWREVLHATLIPHIEMHKEFLTALVAILGTTISPYLFFWQASQEVEEIRANRGEKPLRRAPSQAEKQFDRIRTDTYVGMALSNLIAFFIILTAGVTPHAHGLHNISTSAQAAEALRPIAGRFAFLLFVCGIVGTGLLAVPILATSAAYGLGEACQWNASLENKPSAAMRFYAAITLSIIIGLILNFLHIDPIKALVWSAILNGLTAAPLMLVIMLMASNSKVMGKFVVSPYLRIAGWASTVVMILVGIGAFIG